VQTDQQSHDESSGGSEESLALENTAERSSEVKFDSISHRNTSGKTVSKNMLSHIVFHYTIFIRHT
jgi:hypothetical protein